jgi:hypothetical protein
MVSMMIAGGIDIERGRHVIPELERADPRQAELRTRLRVWVGSCDGWMKAFVRFGHRDLWVLGFS